MVAHNVYFLLDVEFTWNFPLESTCKQCFYISKNIQDNWKRITVKSCKIFCLYPHSFITIKQTAHISSCIEQRWNQMHVWSCDKRELCQRQQKPSRNGWLAAEKSAFAFTKGNWIYSYCQGSETIISNIAYGTNAGDSFILS